MIWRKRGNINCTAALVAFFILISLSLAFAQEDSQNQVAIKQILMNGLPEQVDLAPGLPWEYYDGPLVR